MVRKEVKTPGAPETIGPYSQAIRHGDFLFCSGQLGLDPATGELVEGSVTEQATRALENLKALLHSEGMDFAHVVKATVFLTSLQDFAAMNEVYASYFENPYPARSTIEVSALPKGGLVEIEAIASST